MGRTHSVEGDNSTLPKAANDATTEADVMQAARYTLLSLRNQSLGRLAMRYVHRVDMSTSGIAYARHKECVYGPRFVRMHRFSQAFVMAHETGHHILGHIPQGAILFRQAPKTFSFKAYNIACDAIINWMCENLPNEKNAQSATGIVYAVRRCQEMGIVNWDDLKRSMQRIADKSGVPIDPTFEKDISEVNSIQIYEAMMNVIRRRAAEKKGKRQEREAQDLWNNLIRRIGQLIVFAFANPEELFVSTPLELGAKDLHDALASVARLYRSAEEPADTHGSSKPTEAQWDAVMLAIQGLVDQARDNPLHAFTRDPDRRAHSLWNDLVGIVKMFDPNDERTDDAEKDEEEADEDERSIIDQIAEELNAHDDLREAIEKAADRPENDLQNELIRKDAEFRRAQSEMGTGDILKKVCPPGGQTKTAWRNAVRRMMSSALIAKMSFDYRKPSRRNVSAAYEAMKSGRRGSGTLLRQDPRIQRHTAAKNTWIVIDTSGSIFADRELLSSFIQEAETYGKTVHSRVKIVFADTEVCEVVDVGEAMHVIRTLVPKGGGGTDFRAGIALAEKNNPDLIIYLTDLMGTFPERKPKCPIIWAFPKEFANLETPYGQRLQLH